MVFYGGQGREQQGHQDFMPGQGKACLHRRCCTWRRGLQTTCQAAKALKYDTDRYMHVHMHLYMYTHSLAVTGTSMTLPESLVYSLIQICYINPPNTMLKKCQSNKKQLALVALAHAHSLAQARLAQE